MANMFANAMDKVKETGKKVIDTAGEKKRQFTGENTEAKIEEYSKLYGEVLLGMDKQISELKLKVQKLSEAKQVAGTKTPPAVVISLVISLLALVISVGALLWTNV